MNTSCIFGLILLATVSATAQTPGELRGLLEACPDPSEITQPATDASPLAWGVSYQMMAGAGRYEALRDGACLAPLAGMIEQVWAARNDRTGATDEIRGRVVPAWTSSRYSDGVPYAWAVHTGMITFPIARLSRLLLADPAQTAWHATAEHWVTLVRQSVAVHDDDWHDGPQPGEGAYCGSFGAFAGVPLPLNQSNALGRTLLELADITGEATYAQRAEKLARYLRNRMNPTADGYFDWLYRPSDDPIQLTQGQGEDVSHAAINVDFAALCAERGIVFTPEDMQRLARTFSQRVLREAGLPAANVSGEGEMDPKWMPMIPARWSRLLAFDPGLHPRLLAVFTAPDQPCSTWKIMGLAYLLRYQPPVTE